MLFMACRADTVVQANDEDMTEGEAATVVKGEKAYTVVSLPSQKPAIKGLAEKVQERDRWHISTVQPKSAQIRCQFLEGLLKKQYCRGIPADRMPIASPDSLVIDAALLYGVQHEGNKGTDASGPVPSAGHCHQWRQDSKAAFLMGCGSTGTPPRRDEPPHDRFRRTDGFVLVTGVQEQSGYLVNRGSAGAPEQVG
jgi:hypothetical protein